MEKPAIHRMSVKEMFRALYERIITTKDTATTRAVPALENTERRGVTVEELLSWAESIIFAFFTVTLVERND